MNSEERFKKSLDELLGSKEFPFDESNWEKAREIIDASKRSKRKLAPYILSGLLFLGTLVTGIYFLFGTSETLSIKGKNQARSENTTPAPGVSSQFKNPTSTKPVIKSTEAEEVVTHASPKTALPVIKEQTAATTVKTRAVQQSKQQALPASASEQGENSFSTDPSVKTTTSLEDITTPGLASIEIKMVRSVKTPAAENAAKEESITDKNELPVSETAKPLDTNEKNSGNSAGTTATLPVKSESDPLVNVVSPEIAHTVDNSIQKDNEEHGDEALAADKSRVQDTLKKEVSPNSELSPLVLDGVTEEPKFLPTRFSVEAGSCYLIGWKNPEGRDANGFNPIIGINYFSPVSSKTSLSFGLQYSSVNNLSYSNYTSKVTHLKLGEESEVSVYTPVKLHYLTVPIRFNYDLGLKNTIGLGCNVAYLWTVETELETYTEKLNSTEGHSVSKTFGYTQGFKKIDTQLSAFYRRRLYPNLSVNAEVFFGLTDVKDNKFFNSNRAERNTGVKLTLVYNILKK